VNVLVAGAAGFVGQRLVPALVAEGHRVTALLHRPVPDALRDSFSHERIDVVVMDLAQPVKVDILPTGIDALLLLSQSAAFRAFPQQVDDVLAVNVVAHVQLIDWARSAGVARIVYASSGGVYGPAAPLGVSENERFAADAPLGFYQATKLSAELVLQSFRPLFESTVILRPFFIYGPGQSRSMLIPRLVDSVRAGRAIGLHGADGMKLRPTFVDDAARGFAAALGLTGHHVLNLAGPDVLTLREIGERIGRALGSSVSFEALAGSAAHYVADTARADALLGALATGFDQGITATIAAERERERVS
jgi:UDP-glucose 4-epimerase